MQLLSQSSGCPPQLSGCPPRDRCAPRAVCARAVFSSQLTGSMALMLPDDEADRRANVPAAARKGAANAARRTAATPIRRRRLARRDATIEHRRGATRAKGGGMRWSAAASRGVRTKKQRHEIINHQQVRLLVWLSGRSGDDQNLTFVRRARFRASSSVTLSESNLRERRGIRVLPRVHQLRHGDPLAPRLLPERESPPRPRPVPLNLRSEATLRDGGRALRGTTHSCVRGEST